MTVFKRRKGEPVAKASMSCSRGGGQKAGFVLSRARRRTKGGGKGGGKGGEGASKVFRPNIYIYIFRV